MIAPGERTATIARALGGCQLAKQLVLLDSAGGCLLTQERSIAAI